LTSSQSWRLALPMYNVTPALGRVWQAVLHAIADTLRRQGWQEPMELVEPAELMDFWRAPDLLLSQTCGYPLVTELRKDVRVLAVAEFDLPGCEGPMYRSAILVPELGARAVEELRGKVAAMNQPRSHSGMNALRHAIAPHALGGRFFSDVVASGGHLASMRMLQDGRADVAAIDCVTLGLACRHAPESVAGLRQLQYTQAAPGLPLIGSRRLTDAQAAHIRQVLLDLPRAAPELLAPLAIRRFSTVGLADYQQITLQQQAAIEWGYPVLA